ncbi:hypothetical protein B0H10DRAFT_1946041 [Mycena sp. CBHHK59/15]|nr:hypothetical protein B0H10DRAFT_1946041 [Mycena sp. CBHHK59/15]
MPSLLSVCSHLLAVAALPSRAAMRASSMPVGVGARQGRSKSGGDVTPRSPQLLILRGHGDSAAPCLPAIPSALARRNSALATPRATGSSGALYIRHARGMQTVGSASQSYPSRAVPVPVPIQAHADASSNSFNLSKLQVTAPICTSRRLQISCFPFPIVEPIVFGAAFGMAEFVSFSAAEAASENLGFSDKLSLSVQFQSV